MTLADGIYFGLPDDTYHAGPALGSTDLKQLSIDAVDWQFDRLHGNRPGTDALLFGSALHARVLEGREAFEARYRRPLEMPAGCLVTVDDLKGWLSDNGLPVTGKKADLIERVNLSGLPHPVIWDQAKSDYEAENADRAELPRDMWGRVEMAAQWMQADATLAPSMIDGTFQHGAPEVSVFYTDASGARLKGRFDYLIGHAIIDLKSFAPMYKEHPASSITRAIIRQRYDLQAAAYSRAWHAGRELWKAGAVFGAEPEGLLKRVYSRPAPLWIWVFLKSTGAPQPYVRSISHEEIVFQTADRGIARAIEIFRAKVDAHGIDNIWPPMNAPEALSTSDFPSWFQDA